jgi:hypothetical protein
MTTVGPSTSRFLCAALFAAACLLATLAAARAAAPQCTVQFCASCPADPTCAGCQSGYTLNSNTCFDVNECATSNGGCDLHASCTNTPGSWTCTCSPGFTGPGTVCNDVNECATSNGGCSVTPPVTCTNTVGSFVCGSCPSGYTGNGITCTDVNECATSGGGCDVHASCTNTPGSRTCTCNSGYSGTGTFCVDVNECATNGGGCAVQAQCTNLPGSHTCTCNAGFTGDGVTCNDVNECATTNGGCSPQGQCTNVPGTRFCSCLAGYTGDGITCDDINECATSGGGCDPLTTCTNVPGSRTCSACPSGYSGTGDTACTDVNECATPNACHGGSCTNDPGTFTCVCPAGVTGTTCDVNGYVPPDKDTGKCEAAVASNVAKYVKCVTRCRLQKASKALTDKPFDEQECQGGTKSCRSAYDKKMAAFIAAGTCPACLDGTAQAGLADDALAAVIDTKGRAFCEGTVPLAP